MTVITDKQYEALEDIIYQHLMGISMYTAEGEEIEMGLGEMGDCRDAAQQTIDEWLEKENISREGE